MAKINNDLNTALNIKADIKSAIQNKGQTVTNLASFPNAILNIKTTPDTQTKSVNPTTSQQIITPDSGKYLSAVTVNAVTANIDNNIIADNIKKDISILGVTGTYEGSGGGGSDKYKVFSSLEAMFSTQAEIGDRGIVSGTRYDIYKPGNVLSKMKIVDQVVLDQAITEQEYLDFMPEDSSSQVYASTSLDSSNMHFSIGIDMDMYDINYTSSDGITYNLVSANKTSYDPETGEQTTTPLPTIWELPVNLIANLEYVYGPYEDIFQFIYTEDEFCDGIYIYGTTSKNVFPAYYNIDESAKTYQYKPLDITDIINKWRYNEYYMKYVYKQSNATSGLVVKSLNNNRPAIVDLYCSEGVYTFSSGHVGNTPCMIVSTTSPNRTIHKITWDLQNDTCTLSTVTFSQKFESGSTSLYFVENLESTDYFVGIQTPEQYEQIDGFNVIPRATIYSRKVSTIGGSSTTYSFSKPSTAEANITTWLPYITGTDATKFDIIKGKKAFSNNGMLVGNISTDNIKENFFIDETSAIYAELQTKLDNIDSPIILRDDNASLRFLNSCYFLPARSNGEPLYDFNNITLNSSFISGNPNIRCIGDINLPNINSGWDLFARCYNLRTIGNVVLGNQVNKLTWCFEECDIRKIKSITAPNVEGLTGLLARNPNLTYEGLPVINVKSFTDCGAMFQGCTSLTEVRSDYDFSNSTSLASIFEGCTNLVNIPSSLTFEKCDYPSKAFCNCSNLVNIPVFNFSKVGTGSTKNNSCINAFINNCPNLSNESLNNLMYSVTTVSSSYNGAKQLRVLGISRNQANICYNLPNYSVMTAAGWNLGWNNK